MIFWLNGLLLFVINSFNKNALCEGTVPTVISGQIAELRRKAHYFNFHLSLIMTAYSTCLAKALVLTSSIASLAHAGKVSSSVRVHVSNKLMLCLKL